MLKMQTQDHIPVLYQEVLDLLEPKAGGRFIDGTVGAGGHSYGLLAASAPDGRVLAMDRDPQAIVFARERLAGFGDRIYLVQETFANMDQVASALGFTQVDGILLDLGLSSRQLADAGRGFSFLREGPLDMRFDPTKGQTAADLVNGLPERELEKLIREYGEVRQSRKLARAIVRKRPIQSTLQLASIVADQIGRRGTRHPATQLFQALRIAVNDELKALESGLSATLALLAAGGRMAVISFHSLEDRRVKQFIRDQSRDCICPPEQPICSCDTQPTLRPITRRAVKPSDAEIAANPRSRSARLRVAERTAAEADRKQA